MTFERIRKEGHLLYEYVRGSVAQGISTPESDVDQGGVFIAPKKTLYGLGNSYQNEVSDKRHDTVWFELKRYGELLCKSNPNLLESLFVPDDKRLFVHPLFEKYILSERDRFVTQKCFDAFTKYAFDQIKKAKGLNKKVNNPMSERKDLLDFCYVDIGNGKSIPLKKQMSSYGYNQRYMGACVIPHMREMYSIYYDFGSHLYYENTSEEDIVKAYRSFEDTPLKRFSRVLFNCFLLQRFGDEFYKYYQDYSISDAYRFFMENRNLKFKGLVHPDEIDKSNELRLSSIPKDCVPLFTMSYNQSGYVTHCKDWREYKEWERERNPVRFRNTIEQNKGYDSKNMAHCIRLINMGIEIAKTGKVNVDRSNIDAEFLLDIRNGRLEFQELMDYAASRSEEAEQAFRNSELPKSVDEEWFDKQLVSLREEFYNELKHRGL